MDREEIKKILPHREPMLLLDSVRAVSDDEAEGSYRVRGDEFFLKGHFPGNPVVPGVIQCEIVAQSCCALFAGELKGDRLPMYAGMNRVRFRHPVFPGDEMILHTKITRRMDPFFIISGSVTVDGRKCMDGEFTVALADAKQIKR